MKRAQKFFLIGYLLLATACMGQKIEHDPPNDPIISRQIIFTEQMVYSTGWQREDTNEEAHKIDRYLERKTEAINPLIQSRRMNLQDISKEMVFTVERSFRVVPMGIRKAFAHGYRMLVLLDKNGVRSVIDEQEIKENEWIP